MASIFPEPTADVDFDAAGRVHEWRNYIGERTQKLWPSLTDELRMALALDAEDLAGREEWD